VSDSQKKEPYVYPHSNFPALSREHVDQNARLYVNREDMLSSLGISKGSKVVEVGVALGDFSEFIIKSLEPSEFVAIDLFELHLWPLLWGMSTSELFNSGTHIDYYRRRFEKSSVPVRIEHDYSHIALSRLPDKYFDLIYVDAGHDYDNASRDANISAEKLKDDGVLVFNDYTMFDHLTASPYGVVQAVNELAVSGGWRVVGLGLQHQMFCDIALRRIPK
jgi:hypothetical protein